MGTSLEELHDKGSLLQSSIWVRNPPPRELQLPKKTTLVRAGGGGTCVWNRHVLLSLEQSATGKTTVPVVEPCHSFCEHVALPL